MLRLVHDRPSKGRARITSGRAAVTGVGLAMAVGLAGCSADLGRFDFPNDNRAAGSNSARVASGPIPSEPVRRNAGIPPEHDYPPPYRTTTIEPGPAPAPVREAPPPRYSSVPDPKRDDFAAQQLRGTQPPAAGNARQAPMAAVKSPSSPHSAHHPVPATTTAAAGEEIEVLPGDTLFALSKRHRVSISELMTVNNLQSPALKPGQKLLLPSTGKRAVAQRTPAQRPAMPAPAPVAEAGGGSALVPPLGGRSVKTAEIAPAPSQHAPEAAGTHTVAAGESLYGIARRHGVKLAELQAANGITDPTKVRPGLVLKIPGARAAATTTVAAAPPPASVPPTKPVAEATLPGKPPASGLKVINGPGQPTEQQRLASLGSDGSTRTDVVPAAAEEKAGDVPKLATGKFRWPVRGKVIAAFGPKTDNSHNDGLNIAVPQGTDVAAAESGVVAYTGGDLKGYGNLVLIRHDNNWVSAYAHNDQILVKKGDSVKRGQTIARAGATGTVDQPQVHFELRQGSKPIDPLPHMEKN